MNKLKLKRDNYFKRLLDIKALLFFAEMSHELHKHNGTSSPGKLKEFSTEVDGKKYTLVIDKHNNYKVRYK